MNVCHNSQQHRLPAIIVPGSGPNLLGRDWLAVLKVNWATVYQVDKEDSLVPYKSVFSEGTLNGLTAMFYIEDTIESTNSEKEKEVEESTPASTVSLTGLIVRNSDEQRQLLDDVLDEALKRHIGGIRAPRSCSIIKDITGCDIDADMHSGVDKAVDQTLAAAIDYSDSTTVADEDDADIITHRVAVATMSTCEVAEQEHDDDGTKQDVMPLPSRVSTQSQPLLESDKQVSSLSQNGRMSSELLIPTGATDMRKKTALSCDESKANRKMPGAAMLRKQFEDVDVNYCITEFRPGKGLHCEKLLRPIHVPHMWKRKKKRKPEKGDKERRDQRAVERSFMAGDSVLAMNFLGQPKWVAAVIENRLGPLTFALRLQDNRVWKRHQDHLRERRPNESTEERLCSEERQLQPQLTERDVLPRFVRTPPPPSGNSDETTRTTTGEVISRPTVERSQSRVEPDTVEPLRRSHRVVKAPARLDL